ncbi:Fic family protein [Pirellulales bacterium]|nr:Fic family protein [Pirellulales bacterium]
MAPFNYNWLLKVHREMFGDVWKWGGETRMSDLNLGVKHFLIPQLVGALVLEFEQWVVAEDLLLEDAVRLHHRAVQIHPFLNGNGRSNIRAKHALPPGFPVGT